MNFQIAVDIGGTQLRAACYPSYSLEAECIQRFPTQAPGTTPLEQLEKLIAGVIPTRGVVTAIGVAAPSPVDVRKGVVVEAPNIPGWEELPLVELLEEKFRLPVALGNDANLAALGEWKFGAGQGHHHMIYLTVSTGIGGGVICNDRLLLGERGYAAELGHITVVKDGPLCNCGQHGHLEALASGPAIAKWVRDQLAKGVDSSLSGEKSVGEGSVKGDRNERRSITAEIIARHAEAGDLLALEAFKRAGEFIGIGLVNFIHTFNPTVIVIGGGVSRSGPLLMRPIDQAVKKYIMNEDYLENLEIVTAALGDETGLMGSLALAREFRGE